ncbi:MAG: hypothetical protein KGO49_00530 [Gammaproteobacteria bacterium]|nr:hypothetical protein [Gammaproteobacteria bacterium]
MARISKDENNIELIKILDELISNNVDISAREITRRHPLFSSASSITRNAERKKLVEIYKQKQEEMRQWQSRLSKTSKNDIAEKLTSQEIIISDLEMTVKSLTQAHLALITSVAQIGGMNKLLQFYENYRDIRNILADVGALPDSIK